jgi:hypothetical protein
MSRKVMPLSDFAVSQSGYVPKSSSDLNTMAGAPVERSMTKWYVVLSS